MNEKIITILKTFTEDDVKDFKKFIVSPYFSRGRNFEKYFAAIMKFYPNFEIDKEKFFKSYFGKKNDADGKQSKLLRTLNHDFTKMLEDYIAVDSMNKLRFYNNYLLLEGYSYRGLYVFADEKNEDVMKINEDLDTGYIKDIQMLLLRNLSGHFKSQLNKNSEIYGNVERQSERLLNLLFSFSNQIVNSFRVNNISFKIPEKTEQLTLFFNCFDFEFFLDNLRPDYPDYKMIRLNILLLCSNIENNKFTNLYKKLNQFYMEAFDEMDTREKMNYFMLIMNYYTANQSEEIIRMKFEFVRFALSKKLFPNGELKYVNTGAYKMFLLAGLHAMELDWTDEFIKEYIELIIPEDKENMLNYSNAYIKHYRGNYINSLDYISRYKFEKEVFTNDMKLMQLKNYYELAKQSESYLENLEYSMDAYAHFLVENKKVSEFYKTSGKNFISGMRLLVKLRFGSAKRKKEDIKFDLEKFKSETNNLWLISKINEML